MNIDLIDTIDNLSNRLEQKGLIKEAMQLDIIANTIEKDNKDERELRKEFGFSKDYKFDLAFYEKIIAISKKNDFETIDIGPIKDSKIILLKRKKKKIRGPNLLIVSGLHGDEIGGPFGILKYLMKMDNTAFNSVNVSFIPIVNPIGFRNHTRCDLDELNPNRGFLKNKKISKEGEILRSHLDSLKDMSKDGLLTLHEDVDANSYYIYTYGNKNNLPNSILTTGMLLYRKHVDTRGEIKKGIIRSPKDGSFEEWLYKNGVKNVITTETPGKKDILSRVLVNAMIINTFINNFLDKNI